ncbi:MAG: hypothetical protein NTY09_04835 [bacterium]|nr:hypothetical protein [bacterium]
MSLLYLVRRTGCDANAHSARKIRRCIRYFSLRCEPTLLVDPVRVALLWEVRTIFLTFVLFY